MSDSAASAAADLAGMAKSPRPTAGGGGGSAKWLNKRLGRFKLVGEIGRGAMGRVFRAQDLTLNRLVALKVLPAKTRDGRRSPMIEPLMREARAIASLEHPNIVTVYDVGMASGVYYVAMELIEGGNLEQLVGASGPIDVARACRLAAEAAEALAFAHAAGVIHRDVKPANLMLSRTGRCKVADFGLARVLDPNDSSEIDDRNVGTPLFVAPEVIRGKPATPESDIYSLGATLWYLLTARPVFEGPGKNAVLDQHLTRPVPNLKKLRPDLPEALVEAINVSLAKYPSSRYADAEQFGRILRLHTIPVGESTMSSVGGSGSGVIIRPPAPRLTPMQANTRTLAIAAGAIVVAAVVSVASFRFLVSSDSDREAGPGAADVAIAPPRPVEPRDTHARPAVARVQPSAAASSRIVPEARQPAAATVPPPPAAVPTSVERRQPAVTDPAPAIPVVTAEPSPVPVVAMVSPPPTAVTRPDPRPAAQNPAPSVPADGPLVRTDPPQGRAVEVVPLKNPGFELPQDTQYVAGWLGGGQDWGVADVAPRSGAQHAYSGGKWNSLYQAVDVRPNTVYTFRAWARLKEPAAELTHHVYVSIDPGTDPTRDENVLREWVGADTYTQYTITFRTGPTVKKVHVGTAEKRGAEATAYFDDFELVRH